MATDESASGRHAEFIIIDDPVRPNDGCVGPEDFMGNTFGVPRMRSVHAKIEALKEAWNVTPLVWDDEESLFVGQKTEFERQYTQYLAGMGLPLMVFRGLVASPEDECDEPTIVGEASQEFARQHAAYVARLRKTLREWPDLLPPEKTLTVSCKACNGVGVQPGTPYPEGPGDEYERCDACGGTGRLDDEGDTPTIVGAGE